jgi:hypothetical protein
MQGGGSYLPEHLIAIARERVRNQEGCFSQHALSCDLNHMTKPA